ncbi:MAG: hypothetical protein ACO1QS_07425 [Verrucomicrobiota bacterium]
MSVYWDTSALIHYWKQGRLAEISGVTRTHTLTELFASLTGRGVEISQRRGETRWRRYSPAWGSKIVTDIAGRLSFTDLDAAELLAALKKANAKGVSGGRVHDYLHVLSAEKAGVSEIWTTDVNDLSGLGKVPVKVVA